MKSSNENTVFRHRQAAHSELQLAIENGDSIVCHSYELPTTPSWNRFENFLRTKLQLQDFKVTYKDEERDEVNLSSDEEFYELLNVYDKINNNVLLIRVTPVKTDYSKEKNIDQDECYIDADGFPKQPNYIPLGKDSILRTAKTLNDRFSEQQKVVSVNTKITRKAKLPISETLENYQNYETLFESGATAPTADVDVMPLNIGNEQKLEDIPPRTVMGCRPKEPIPPDWFSSYMDKFKGDITLEITKKVMHRMQKLLARNGSLVLKPEENKDAESGDKQSKPVSNIVHIGVMCDNCDQNIIGIRYRCGNCAKYDLCEICESLNGIHDPQHVFIKMRYPAKFGGLRRKHGKTGPLLRHLIYDYDDIILDGSLDKITRSTSAGDAPAPDFSLHWREKKLLKRLEKHAHKLEKYREKHRQHRGICENITRTIKTKEEIAPSSEDSGIVDKSSCFNPFWTDLLNAKFLKDETIPDGTVMAPGSHFTKRWRLLNSGEMRWPADTVLKFLTANGDKNGLKHSKNQVSVPPLLPGEEGIVNVDFVAPFQPGKCESVWRLHVHNNFFGHKIWCSIIVERSALAVPMPDVQVDQINSEKMKQEPENGEKEQVPDILKAGLEETTTLKMNKWANFQREDNATNNGFTTLLVPRCASITATPNNTPLDLTPPKSPEIPEDGNETLFDNTLVTRKLEDDVDASFLSDDSDHGGSVLSLSSTDSEMDYVMVPLPPCFNYLIRELEPKSDSTNTDDTEAPTVPVSPTGKEENSSVTAASDTDDENANDTKSNINYETKSSPPPPPSPPFQTSFTGTFSDHATVASHIAALAATAAAAVNSAIPLPPPPPPPPLPPTEEIDEPKIESSNSPPDVCPERVIPILPEPLMSAAATVFNSARGLITSIADKKNNSIPEVSPSSLARLTEMGFYDRELNANLLRKYNEDMIRVIAELLEKGDNNWHTNRH